MSHSKPSYGATTSLEHSLFRLRWKLLFDICELALGRRLGDGGLRKIFSDVPSRTALPFPALPFPALFCTTSQIHGEAASIFVELTSFTDRILEALTNG